MIEQNDVVRRGGMEEGDSLDSTAAESGTTNIATLTVTEAVDNVSGTGVAPIAVRLNRVEANDTLSASANRAFDAPIAILDVTEESDVVNGPQADQDETLAATGAIRSVVDAQYSEASDTLTGDAVLGAIALVELNVTEAIDTLTSAVLVEYRASLTRSEGSDSVSGSAEVTGSSDVKTANLSIVESADICSAVSITGNPVIAGGGISRRRRRRWILPDGTEIYADEDEVRKILEDLRAGKIKPKEAIAKLKQKPLDPFLEVWDEEPPKVESKRKSTDDEDFLAMLDLL